MRYFRLYKILVIFRAYQLSELLPNHRFSTRFKYIVGCLFWVRKRAKNSDVGERLRFALQELGPVWIKFGQMLSTRQDILPENIANQLIKLQDQVPPFDGDIAKQIVEEALQQPIEALFIDFNTTPLASASIAQVHTAILKRSGAKVVIKVLRPQIMPIIQADLALMYWLANLIECHITDSKRLRINDVINDYERTILNELNLLREAENTRRLRQNFMNSDILYIPYVYRDLCRQNVMVEERISGIPISDIEQLKRNNVNLRLLAERGVQAFFTQVFRDNFFHADMHPGNIFVDASQPINPRYIGIDCAIVGELSREDQRYLAENFIAFFNRDYRKIAELYLSSGWIAEDTDILAFESSMRSVCDPIFAKPLGEISFAQVLFNLFKVARQYNMEIQPQLILLEKTLFYIEGLGRQLYPQLDLWSTAKPFLESWYQEQVSIKTVTQQGIDMLPQWRDLLIVLPNKIRCYEKNSQQMQLLLGQLTLQLQHTQKRQSRFFIMTVSVIIIAVVALVVVFS